MARAVRLVALVLALACAACTCSAADAPASSALGIFANADAVPELQATAFVGTVFVPNDAAVAAFLRAAQLTPRQLRENSTLVNALARQHVVPLVALRRLDFDPEETLTTLSQRTLRVRPTAGVYIVVADRSSAVITVPDIVAGGAILHVINDMLIPAGVDVEL